MLLWQKKVLAEHGAAVKRRNSYTEGQQQHVRALFMLRIRNDPYTLLREGVQIIKTKMNK